MNESSDHRDQLVADLFHEDWALGPVSAFARAAAAQARRRRHLRQGLLATGTATALLALVALALLPRRPAARGQSAPVPPAPAYEIISDDELIARLHDRPLLILPGKNGGRDLVLLER